MQVDLDLHRRRCLPQNGLLEPFDEARLRVFQPLVQKRRVVHEVWSNSVLIQLLDRRVGRVAQPVHVLHGNFRNS